MSTVCQLRDCDKTGVSFCGRCGLSRYCSSQCQRADWKTHKAVCKKVGDPKLLDATVIKDKLQQYYALGRKYRAEKKLQKAIEVSENALEFTMEQLDVRNIGGGCRTKKNGDVVKEIYVILIYTNLIEAFISEKSHASLNKAIARTIETRQLIEMSPIRDGPDPVVEDIEFDADLFLARIYLEKSQFSTAAQHCQLSVEAVKRQKSANKAKKLFGSLTVFSDILSMEGNPAGALVYSEEAYNTVSVAFGPEDLNSLEAAGNLVNCLIEVDDYETAERYGRVTYEALIDKANKIPYRSQPVALSMLILVRLFTRIPTLERAAQVGLHGKEIEELILKACDIVFSLVSPNHPDLLPYIESLVDQCVCRNVYSEAVRALLEGHEPLARKSEETESNMQSKEVYFKFLEALATFHCGYGHGSRYGEVKILEFRRAKEVYKRAVVVAAAVYGPHDECVGSLKGRIRLVDMDIDEVETVMARRCR
jgi:tetratricopeptide (TPR) repeat protein